MPHTPERRKSPRIPVHIPAGIYLKDKPYEVIDAEILSISEGGAFVQCGAPIELGKVVLIEIRFAETSLVEAKVVEEAMALEHEAEQSVVKWNKGSNNQMGFGVEFVGLKGDKRKFLTKLVSYFQQLHGAGANF